jgi:hypothetical protein
VASAPKSSGGNSGYGKNGSATKPGGEGNSSSENISANDPGGAQDPPFNFDRENRYGTPIGDDGSAGGGGNGGGSKGKKTSFPKITNSAARAQVTTTPRADDSGRRWVLSYRGWFASACQAGLVVIDACSGARRQVASSPTLPEPDLAPEKPEEIKFATLPPEAAPPPSAKPQAAVIRAAKFAADRQARRVPSAPSPRPRERLLRSGNLGNR